MHKNKKLIKVSSEESSTWCKGYFKQKHAPKLSNTNINWPFLLLQLGGKLRFSRFPPKKFLTFSTYRNALGTLVGRYFYLQVKAIRSSKVFPIFTHFIFQVSALARKLALAIIARHKMEEIFSLYYCFSG